MVIDYKKYSLEPKNYIQVESVKKQIVIGNTFNHGMRHFNGWKNRLNGQYTKTTQYTIAENGKVYQHFDPSYQSTFFGDNEIDGQTIVILIENDGWLLKDNEKNLYITWVGDIYSNSNKVIEKRWRGYNYWSAYNNKQMTSAVELVKKLCDEFYIPLTSINHNTKIDGVLDYRGVLYRSNFDKHHTDLSPAWDCQAFKEKLEK